MFEQLLNCDLFAHWMFRNTDLCENQDNSRDKYLKAAALAVLYKSKLRANPINHDETFSKICVILLKI